jgi:hypothetical protein
VLFVSLGSIATTGGLISVYVGPEVPSQLGDQIDLTEFVIVSRTEWARTRDELVRLRTKLGVAPPPEPEADMREFGISEDRSHLSLLRQVEELGGGTAPPPHFARNGAVARAANRPPSGPVNLLPSAIVGPSPPEGGGEFEGARVAAAPPARRPVAPSRLSIGVEVPPVPPSTSQDAMQQELDRQIDSALGPDALGGRVAPGGPRQLMSEEQKAKKFAPRPSRPEFPPQEGLEETPPPALPRGVTPVPRTVPPAAPAVPATPQVPTPASPEEDAAESFTEETPSPGGAGIEDLAKKFGALVSPSGFLPMAPLPASTPPAPARPVPSAANTWFLPNLRALRPWPGSGRFDWEMASLRISMDYCIPRAEGEEPEAFMDRAELLLQQGIPIPPADRMELDRSFAVCGSLMQAYRHLTSKEIEVFSSQVRPEVERIGTSIGFPLRPGDDLLTYAQQMRGVLAVFEKTGVLPVSLPPPSPPPAAPPAPSRGGEEPASAERGAASPAPGDAKGSEQQVIDAELDRLVAEVGKDLPGASAPASRKKRSS